MRRTQPPHRSLPPAEWFPAGAVGVRAAVVASEGGERVRVLESGAAGAPPVLLLHGWGASAYGYRRLLPHLAAAGLRAIAPDLRGHGLSDKPRDPGRYTSAALAAQLLDLLDGLGVPRALVAGQSMGGALAIDLARRAPERVRAVLLLAPVGLTRIARIAVARALRLRAWYPRTIPRAAIELQLRRVYGTRRGWDQRDVDEYWAPMQCAGSAAALVALVEGFDWTPRQPLDGIPVRALLGERDRLVPAGAAARALARFPGARFRVLSQVGHLPAEEAPEDVSREIVELRAATA